MDLRKATIEIVGPDPWKIQDLAMAMLCVLPMVPELQIVLTIDPLEKEPQGGIEK